ncbi:MAG TPA: DUF2254 domain-containing protein [Pseudonocardia sp.]|nr:DUF2254 domain-containing protein [Pseudonocardia sp.]
MAGTAMSLRERFWLLPTAFAVVAGLLAEGLARLDAALWRSADLPFLFGGGPEGARALLSAIVTSMISFTALVFSITIVVLQLTSQQFSPRVLRTFLRDRFNQVTLGVFVATFVHAMVVLRSVRGTAQVEAFVPQLAVTAAFGLVLASTVVFLFYLHHTAQSIRVATIITSIAGEAREVLARGPREQDDLPVRPPAGAGPVRVVAADRPGVIQGVDGDALARHAAAAGSFVEVLRAVGEFVPSGAALLRVHGGERLDDARLLGAIRVGEERTPDQDLGFALRQLVDIATRALSPGVNDPTTAVQVLDQLHDLLRRLASRPLPSCERYLVGDRLAALVPAPGLAEYLDLALDEIGRWGGDDERVCARVRGLLRDVRDAARPEHRGVAARKLRQWGGFPAPPGMIDLSPSDVGLRPARPGAAADGRPRPPGSAPG